MCNWGFFAIIVRLVRLRGDVRTCVSAVGLLVAGTIAATGAAQTAPPNSAPAPSGGQQPQSLQSGYVLKVKTRLVSLDVVATDSHGNVVRDLKPEELQIFAQHNEKQEIAQFEFIDRLGSASNSKTPTATESASKGVYSNQALFEHLTTPPTVLLMDALNSPMESQMQARIHMLRLLQTLLANTPVAVFLLGNTLRLVQGFTSNPAVLRAAIDRCINPTTIEQDPRDDTDSVENSDLDITDEGSLPGETVLVQSLEDFEKEHYASTMDVRVQGTLDTLTAIARFLSGVPGRKNLIWLSESFPFFIAPNTDTGNDTFAGIRNYGDRIEAAADALTDAQVAVYPLDLRGLQTPQLFTASQQVNAARGRPTQMGGQIRREQYAQILAQDTMNALANETGGKTCANTNDLSGCVQKALDNSSSYYELAFYPRDVKWNGEFQRIEVKTSRRGVKLIYRRGYFAVDGDMLAKVQKPEDRLYQACSDPLPSTAIGLAARPVPPPGSAQKYELAYLLSIGSGEVSVVQTGESREIRLQVATCDFGAKGDSFRFLTQTMTQKISEDAFKFRQSEGIPQIVLVKGSPHTQRVRIAVLDEPTGLVGALDIPVPPEELEKAAAPPAVPLVRAAAIPVLEVADKQTAQSQPKPMGALIFHGPSGQSGTLDWNGDALIYQGDLDIEQSAPAFFSYAFGAKYQCQSGNLVSINAAGSEPKLQVTFRNHDGKIAVVDLKGVEPQYSGDLPVNSEVKALFDRVWQLSHCVLK